MLCLPGAEYSNCAVRGKDEVSWFVSRKGHEASSSPKHPDRLRGPVSCRSKSTRGLFIGVERPGDEADHPSPSSAAVNNWRSSVHTAIYLPRLALGEIYTDATKRRPTDRPKYFL